MNDFGFLHYSNIAVHVITGLIALILGLVILLTKKGARVHRKMGRTFLALLTIVVISGLFGVLIFRRNTFLLVLTVSSGYTGYSGFRAVRTKSNNPKSIDIFAALLDPGSALYFLYYIKSIGMIWSPILIYATVGFLFLVIAYDLLRYLIPEKKYNNSTYKTDPVQSTPHSCWVVPTTRMLSYLGFIIYFYKKRKHSKKEWSPLKKS